MDMRLFYRPSVKPAVAVPFGARSVGHYMVPPNYSDKALVKHFVQVFWGIAGTGAIKFDTVECKLGPGQVAIYFPGAKHQVYSLEESWEYRWWTMDGALAVETTEEFGLRQGKIYDVGPAPVDLFVRLENAVLDNTPDGERKASAVAYKLLCVVAGGSSGSELPTEIDEALKIIHQFWADPGFGVEGLADKLNMDRSVLSRLFKSCLKISPVKYLINLRIQNALSQLKQSREPVGKVAESCGWSDPNYFSRIIRQATGLSPKEFRHQ